MYKLCPQSFRPYCCYYYNYYCNYYTTILIVIHIIILAARFIVIFTRRSYIIFYIIDRLSITELHELINSRQFSSKLRRDRVTTVVSIGNRKDSGRNWIQNTNTLPQNLNPSEQTLQNICVNVYKYIYIYSHGSHYIIFIRSNVGRFYQSLSSEQCHHFTTNRICMCTQRRQTGN